MTSEVMNWRVWEGCLFIFVFDRENEREIFFDFGFLFVIFSKQEIEIRRHQIAGLTMFYQRAGPYVNLAIRLIFE